MKINLEMLLESSLGRGVESNIFEIALHDDQN
jgi:hypothetical protein